MNNDELFEYVKLSSLPLRKLGQNRMPISSASGCIIDYRQKRIILTVQHAAGRDGNWRVEVKYETGKGTLTYPLNEMNFLASVSLADFKIEDVDLCYAFVTDSFNSFYQEISPNGDVISETPRIICRVDFDHEPNLSDSYGFSGQVGSGIVGNLLIGEHRVYRGLKFVKTHDDLHIFKLPMRHPGHEYFEGCSGAPIIDSQGNAVALVCKGDTDKDYIFGISLKRYQVAIDLTIDNL